MPVGLYLRRPSSASATGGVLGGLIRRRKVGLVTDGSPARMSRVVGDLIKDNRRRPRAVQFPLGWLEPNARAPVGRHEVAAVRPPAVRIADAGVDALGDFLNNYKAKASTDMEKALYKTDHKNFLTPLCAGPERMCGRPYAAGWGRGS